MSKKNPQKTKAKAERAKRAAEAPTQTPDVIQLSDQAAADPTINTQSADELVIDNNVVENTEISYDLSGKGDDLVDDTQDTDQPEPKKSNEQMALDSMRPEMEDDITFEVSFAEYTEKLKEIPAFLGRKLKAANDAIVNGWQYLTDKMIEPAVDKFYAWCHKNVPKMPVFVTAVQLKTLTATLADVFAEVTNENRIKNAEVLTELAELKQEIKRLTSAVNGKHPMTIPAEALNEIIFLIRDGEKSKAANKYMQRTGSTLAVAREFVGSVSVA